MQENDYSALNQAYSLGQLRNNSGYVGMTDSDAKLKENLQTAVNYLLQSEDINKAEGLFLDNWGLLVGITRRFFNLDAYFKFNSPDVNVEKYIWFSEPKSDFIVPSGSMEDRDFRARIKAKAGANTSKCTREDNIAIIKNMTFAKHVKIKNVAPMLLDITLVGDNLFYTQDTQADIETVLGSGVGIRNLKVERANGNS